MDIGVTRPEKAVWWGKRGHNGKLWWEKYMSTMAFSYFGCIRSEHKVWKVKIVNWTTWEGTQVWVPRQKCRPNPVTSFSQMFFQFPTGLVQPVLTALCCSEPWIHAFHCDLNAGDSHADPHALKPQLIEATRVTVLVAREKVLCSQ